MRDKSDKKLIELRIARAYVELLCIPDDGSALRAISITRVGDHEIRLFEHSQIERADAPLSDGTDRSRHAGSDQQLRLP